MRVLNAAWGGKLCNQDVVELRDVSSSCVLFEGRRQLNPMGRARLETILFVDDDPELRAIVAGTGYPVFLLFELGRLPRSVQRPATIRSASSPTTG